MTYQRRTAASVQKPTKQIDVLIAAVKAASKAAREAAVQANNTYSRLQDLIVEADQALIGLDESTPAYNDVVNALMETRNTAKTLKTKNDFRAMNEVAGKLYTLEDELHGVKADLARTPFI